MITLSGFTDEALASFPGQLRMARGASLTHVELRRLGVRPILEASGRQLHRAQRELANRGVRVSSIATGLGKEPVDALLAPQLERLRRAADLAHRFDTPYVRTFSWFTDTPDADRGLVLEQLVAFADVAEQEGVVLLHENEKGVFGDVPERCLAIVEATDGRIRLIVDPANFVQCGVRPLDAWHQLSGQADALHAKDARSGTGRVVPVGLGDGQWHQIASELAASDWEGFISLEPHLGLGGRGGPVTPARWSRALARVRRLLQDAGVRITA